jgi:hypothetical protein
VALLGFKLSALKRLVQVNQRRTELQAALVSLQPKVEAEKLAVWLADVEHDAKQREDRIAAMDSAAGRVYNMSEAELLAKGAGMFAAFEASSASAKQLPHSALILNSETKLDAATGLLLGRAAAMVRATPQEIVVHMLNYDSLYMKSIIDPTVFIRSEVVEHVNSHQTIIFNRFKLGAGLSQRTFLNSLVAKKVEDDPLTYLLVGLPIAQHDKITPKDEKGAVRAENCRAFKLTEVSAGITKLEYTCSLNACGSIPQAFTNKVSVPGQLNGAPPDGSRALPLQCGRFASLAHDTCSPENGVRVDIGSVRCSADDPAAVLPADSATRKVRRRGRPSRRPVARRDREQKLKGSGSCDPQVRGPHSDAPRLRFRTHRCNARAVAQRRRARRAGRRCDGHSLYTVYDRSHRAGPLIVDGEAGHRRRLRDRVVCTRGPHAGRGLEKGY